MRKFWLRSLALSLGLVATGARGQEGVWQAPQSPIATSQAAPAPQVQAQAIASSTAQSPAPAASTGGSAVTLGAPVPIATIGRPVAISGQPVQDPGLQPVSFTTSGQPKPIARGAAPDLIPSRPMPVGPSGEVIGIPANTMHSWRRPDGVPAMPASRNQASATSVAPPPVTGGPTTLVPPTPIGGAPTPSLPGAIGDTIGKGLTSPSIPSSPLPGQPGVPEIIPSPGVISGQPLPIPGGVIPTPGGVISGPVIGSIPGMPPAPGIPLGLGQGGTACDPSPASCAAWGDCGDCCDRPKFTIGGEFLLWWTKGDQTPALVTAAPPGQAPLLINPATTIMYGGNQLADGARPGGRIFGTYWFGNDNLWGMDASGFFLGNDNQSNYTIENAGNVYSLGRPFSDTSSGALVPSVEEVAGPGLAGGVVISRQSNLWGADANLRRNLCCSNGVWFDLLFGGRVLGMDESLDITENLIVKQPPQGSGFQPGDRLVVNDRFSAFNRFYGGQIGFDSEYRWHNMFFGLRTKVAIGCTEQQVTIAGSTKQNNLYLTNVATGGGGGLLAQSGTNIGTYGRKMFGVVPEVGFTVGYNVFDWCRVFGGYNFLYWNNVARPGEQISPDLRVNKNFAPGAPAPVAGVGPRDPSFPFSSSDFWAQGVSLGMEFRY